MTEIVPFDFEGTAVRVLTIDGEPWWVAADICAVLDIRNSRDALSSLDDDEKGVGITDTLGGRQQMTTVNEPGLYSLILRSRKPQAKAFKRWITHEVIPSIRRAGAYSLAAAPPPPAAVMPTHAEALRGWAGELERRQIAEARAEEEKRRRRELEPLAAAGRTFTEIKGTVSVAVAAGHLSNDLGIKVGRDRLFTKMRDLGWICREGRGSRKCWRAKQTAIDSGKLREYPNPFIDQETGERQFGAPTIQITSKGLSSLYAHYYGEAQGRLGLEDAG